FPSFGGRFPQAVRRRRHSRASEKAWQSADRRAGDSVDTDELAAIAAADEPADRSATITLVPPA
ncbi:MAG TPA: hypothetical protein VK306_01315, partial [Acidimicrobiales bacterium]|nr:hypothetical protein [Acidimicrobiales bacterium]